MIVLFPPRAFAWGGLVKGVRVLTLTDIHCHLMPKVDDGPSTILEAKQLLQMEYDDGVRNIILTPHYRVKMFEPDMKEVIHYYRGMRGAAAKIAPDFKVYLGCEYHTNSDMIEDLQRKKRPTLAGSRYVLVEFSSSHTFQRIRNQIYDLVVAGYKPVIAHIERYPDLIDDIDNIWELIELGAYVQLNAASVLGEYGKKTKQFCKRAMKEDCVHFIASDAHGTEYRKPNLGKCAKYVTKKMGKEYAERIFVKNPEKILRKE